MAASAWTLVPPDAAAWTPVAPDAPKPDARNAIQKSFDTNTQINPSDTLLQKGLKSVVGTVGAPFVHPIDSIMGLIPKDFATQYQEAQKQPKQSLASGLVTGAGQAFGNLVLGAVGGEGIRAAAPIVAPVITPAMEAVGSKMQDIGINRINKTVGSLTEDFRHGSNPARGYLDQNLGASSSQRSIASKADAALSDVGQKLGQVYEKASANTPKIPVQDVADAIAQPIRQAHDLETGAFGGGNTGPLEDYAARIKPVLAVAQEKGGFTPKELFDLKQRLTQNINWRSTDPGAPTLNGIREDQYGALTQILSDAVPETKKLNQAYSDLSALKKRASLRADTGSQPLTNFKEQALAASGGSAIGTGVGAAIAGPTGAAVGGFVGGGAGLIADSIPAKTAVASGIYKGGRALSSAASRFRAGTTEAGGNYVAGGNPNEPSNGSSNNNQNNYQVQPPNGVYGTTDVTPEIINPSQMSRSRMGVGIDGRGGTLIRPLAQLPAPAPPPGPSPGLYGTTNVPADVINANALSQSRMGIGQNGRGGTLVRPMGLLPAPEAAPLKGSALWQELGAAKLQDHISRETNSDVSPSDISKLANTPQGKSLLIQASDLSPGSAAMKNLTKQIQAVLGRTK